MLPFPLLCLIAQSDNLYNFLLVEILKATRCNDFIVVLLGEQQARLLQPLAIERVRIFEDLTNTFNADVLRKDLFTALLETWHIEPISQRQQLINVFGFDAHGVRINVSQEHHEEIVRDIVVGGDTLLLFCEIVGEAGLKIGRPGGENDLMAVNGLSFDHKCDVAELWLVED